jgi:hypothetical protein
MVDGQDKVSMIACVVRRGTTERHEQLGQAQRRVQQGSAAARAGLTSSLWAAGKRCVGTDRAFCTERAELGGRCGVGAAQARQRRAGRL